jgi:hypothetical protein
VPDEGATQVATSSFYEGSDWRDTLSVDEISLTLPADEAFHRVAHLVVGGLAVRLDLTFEHLEDLELALDGLFDCCVDQDDLTVVVKVHEGELAVELGPFPGDRLARFLARERDGLGLRKLLEIVTDGFAVLRRNGEDWVELRKRVAVKR